VVGRRRDVRGDDVSAQGHRPFCIARARDEERDGRADDSFKRFRNRARWTTAIRYERDTMPRR
jgi:hypothetical protein